MKEGTKERGRESSGSQETTRGKGGSNQKGGRGEGGDPGRETVASFWQFLGGISRGGADGKEGVCEVGVKRGNEQRPSIARTRHRPEC